MQALNHQQGELGLGGRLAHRGLNGKTESPVQSVSHIDAKHQMEAIRLSIEVLRADHADGLETYLCLPYLGLEMV